MPSIHDISHAVHAIWLRTLREVAERDGGVDLMPWTGGDIHPGSADRKGRHCRVRLLEAADDGHIVVQEPIRPDHQRWVQPGEWLLVQLTLNNQRWTGRCRVTACVQTYAINQRRRVAAVQLEAAVEVKSAQRRQSYRAPTATLAPPPLRLWPVLKGEPDPGKPADADAAHDDGEPVQATLLNISAGGIGASVDPVNQPVQQLLLSRRYRCRLALPIFGDPITLTVQLVHVAPQRDRTVYLGMKFEFDSASMRHGFANSLSRFTADLERAALRSRRRGA